MEKPAADFPDDESGRQNSAQEPASRRTESPAPEDRCTILRLPIAARRDSLALNDKEIETLARERGAYEQWIASMPEGLCARAQAVIRSSTFEKLKDVHNCTVVDSKVMSFVDVTRWEHCIHAAFTAHILSADGKLGLNEREQTVLTLVMLLHDAHHGWGSHALDRVYASLPGSPSVGEFWGGKDDFHEYHGVQLLARGQAIREALGEYRDDVLSVLSRQDTRPAPEREADYGMLRPSLAGERLDCLGLLSKELDLSSYLKLDHLRSGFTLQRIKRVIRDVEQHEKTLRANQDGYRINISRETEHRPYERVAQWRHDYRAFIATHPIGCLVEAVIYHHGFWEKAKQNESFPPRELGSRAFYEWARDRANAGDYGSILSEEALEFRKAARTGEGYTVEDVYAPIVTLTLADVSEAQGRKDLRDAVSPQLSQALCNVPRSDMSVFEARLRATLLQAKLPHTVHVLVSDDFSKVHRHPVSVDGETPRHEELPMPCPPSLIKITVAARAIAEDGTLIDLSNVGRVVREHLINSKFVKDPAVLDKLNPFVFCEAPDLSVFDPDYQRIMRSYVPAWIRLSGVRGRAAQS